MKTYRCRKVLLVGIALLLVASAVSAAWLLKEPSGGTAQAVDDPDGLKVVTDHLAIALGIPPEGLQLSSSYLPLVENADAVVLWAKGSAQVDTKAGRVMMISQEAVAGDITAKLQDYAELDRQAALFAELLGWDEAALANEGFRPDESGLFSEVMCVYHETWVSYTSQGVRDNGLIQVKLDARDGRLVTFYYFPGVGDIAVDSTQALLQDEAVAIAKETVGERVLQEIKTVVPVEDQARASELAWHMAESDLKLTDAPAVTGGDTKLIWVVAVEGKDGTGRPIRGTVYIDAMTGAVLQELI